MARHVGRQREGERYDAHIRRAALRHLERLRDIFAHYELVLHRIVDPRRAQSGLGGASIGRVLRIRDGDVPHGRQTQRLQAKALDIDAGGCAGPEHDAPVGVTELAAGQDQSLLRQLVRILHVRG